MLGLLLLLILSFVPLCPAAEENLTVNLGQDVTFSCLFPDPKEVNLVSFMYQTTGAILSVGLELFLDRSLGNNPIELQRFSPSRLDLKIFAVNQNDSGLYTCMLDHHILSTFLLEILVPPRFSSYWPSEATLTYTEQLPMNLSCHVFAVPPASITWRYTNNQKQSKIIHTGEGVYLSSIKSVDSGVYECVAANGYHGSISRLFYVTVQYSPRIHHLQLRPSSSPAVELLCEVCAVPPATIHWLSNGTRLRNNRQFLIGNENGECTLTTLTIRDSAQQRDGRYECWAENLLGHRSEHIDTHSKTVIKSRATPPHFAVSTEENMHDASIGPLRISKLTLSCLFLLVKLLF